MQSLPWSPGSAILVNVDSINFFSSSPTAEILEMRHFSIHGANFVELTLRLEEDGSIRRTRVSDNLVYADPKPGDRVRVEFLMGNVARVEKLEGPFSPDSE